MIYGNKFLEVSCENNISLFNIDYDNYLNLAENYLSETTTEYKDNIFAKISDKIVELFNKFIHGVKSLVDKFKLQIVKLRNKFIKSLDTKINGKFTPNESDDISEEEINKTFSDIEVIEAESISESTKRQQEYIYTFALSKVEFLKIDSVIDDTLDFVTKYLDQAYSYYNSYGNSYEKHKELKEKYKEYEDEFRDNYYSKIKDSETLINGKYKDLMDALAEVKSNKNKEFKNNYFEVEAVDITIKQNLKTIREMLISDGKEMESVIKRLIDEQKEASAFKSKVDIIERKYDRMEEANGAFKWNAPTWILSNICKIAADNYKYYSAVLKSLFYMDKMNFKVAYRQVKHWGKELDKENK